MRRTLRPKRDEQAFRTAQQELLQLHQREQRGELELYYGDQTGLSLQPELPYAWQKPGSPGICADTAHRRRLSIFGLLSCLGSFRSYTSDGSMTSEVIVGCIDEFVKHLKRCQKRSGTQRPVVIVLDNAPIHTSALFQEHRQHWQQANVTVKFLPRYSPELNMIEILWKRIKYAWLPLEAYESWQKLTSGVEDVLKGIGRKYQITFS